ncbi:hypothetical protein J7438_11700 [Thalassotalea sp. G20_0]|nr:hypothetical protein [Thalassotalea sp. G20_0]
MGIGDALLSTYVLQSLQQYTNSAPRSSLVIGTIVSEGCCSGVAVCVCATTPRPVAEMPAGAIPFADYAGDLEANNNDSISPAS